MIEQPAFIYSTFPNGTTVTAAPASTGQDPGSVLAADEAEGYSFDTLTGTPCLVVHYPSPVPCDCLALVGSGLSGASIAVAGSNDNFASQNVSLLAATPTVEDRAFWSGHTAGTYSSYKYSFTGLTTKSRIKHLAPALLALLPFMADGACFAPLQSEGDHLVSHAGLYLGSVTNRVMRPFSLNFGQVDPEEEAVFAAMVSACVATPQGLFFVPDTSQPQAHFGWIKKDWSYTPKMKTGLYEIPAIPFTSRAL